MARVKLKYNQFKAHMELRNEGSTDPIAFMNAEEFADFLEQVFAFTEKNNPQARELHEGRMKKGFHGAMRKEAWFWIKGAVKDKVKGWFKKSKV